MFLKTYWLKYEVHGAGKFACLGEVTRCAQQHGRVPVVTARMHAPVMFRPIRNVVGLVYRQGIHIRPQSDRGTIAGPKHANHAGLADVAMNLAAELGKLASDELRRRCSSKPSSGCACKSCRQTVISP
jgi:hypothetical protein